MIKDSDIGKEAAGRPIRLLGNVSLAVAFFGFLAVEVAMASGWVAGAGWVILVRTLEAASIGGIADWFAVRALFHEVPVPVLRKHTNIIVKNRPRITDGIAKMVQNQWLSPAAIREYLTRISASHWVLEHLADKSKADAALSVVRDLLRQAARGMDGPDVVAFLDRALKDQLRGLEIAAPLGRWMGNAMRRGDHEKAWDVVLSRLDAAADSEELRTLVRNVIRRAVEEYGEGGIFRNLGVKAAQFLDVLDEEDAAAAMLRKMKDAVSEARGDRGHPLRIRLDGILLAFADDLADGKPETVEMVETLRSALMVGADAHDLLGGMLSRLRRTLESELDTPDSDLDRLMTRVLHDRLAVFREDPKLQNRVDDWVRETAILLVEKRHSDIGDIVRRELGKLSDTMLVTQIEGEVGDDLQYIRLNGAIVGGMVGAVIAIVRTGVYRGI